MPTNVYQTAQADVNASGQITLVYVSPGLGTTWTGVISIINAIGSENWSAFVSGSYWGSFFGTGQFGIIQCSGSEQISIQGSGLTPGRSYQANFIAYAQPTDQAGPAFPQPAPSGTVGTTGAVGINQITSTGGTIAVTNPTGPIANLETSSLVARIVENVNTVAASGAAQTIPDVTTDTINYITLTANCTFTFPAAAAGKSFLLGLLQDATGSRTVTWPGTVKWAGGTAPTLTTTAGKLDLFSFVCLDGTNWLGIVAGESF